MNTVINFYHNSYSVNNKKKYYFNDIMKWDDYKLEKTKHYIDWLFPEKLTKGDIHQFKNNVYIRSKVVEATLRMFLFYGFVLDESNGIKQVKELNRRDRGITVGLFSIYNYNRITRILNFLVMIDMEYLSAIFFLALCNAFKSNNSLLNKVVANDSLREWMYTQKYLIAESNNYDVTKLNTKIFINQNTNLLNESDNSHTLLQSKKCNIKGLNYTGNSCYMDSTLLCIFAIPNKTITDNILKKDISKLKALKNNGINLWSKCDEDINNDIKIRQDIQKALNDITDSMRGLYNVKKCSNLRSLIKKCPGSQPFHETGTQDSGEFLSYLFNLFQVDVASTRRRSYGCNDLSDKPKWTLVREIIDKNSSPIIDVVSTTLQTLPKDYDITKLVKQTQDSILEESNIWIPNKNNPTEKYIRRKEIFRVRQSPIIIFNLVRTYGEASFAKPMTKLEKITGRGKFKGIVTKNIWTRILAPETMTLNNNKLTLNAIVVHTGGAHYIANFKCNGNWFWYDDSPGLPKHTIKYIGSYENMLKTHPNPLTHGTLYFYT